MGMKKRLKHMISRAIARNGPIREIMLKAMFRDGIRFFKDFGDNALVFYPQDHIGKQLLLRGQFGRDMVHDVAAFLTERGHGFAGKHILEIGANIGTQTVYFCREMPGASVIALEPDEMNFRLLEANCALNGITGRVTALKMGASNEKATLEFLTNPYNMGASKVYHGEAVAAGFTRSVIAVDRIDAVLADLGIPGASIAFVWVDAEGHEPLAFAGMQRLIDAHHPPIFFEYSPDRHDEAQRAALKRLAFGQYDEQYVCRAGFHPIDEAGFDRLDMMVDILVRKRG